MMARLRAIAAEVQLIYDEMGAVFSTYQRESGLSCPSDCGACCLQPTIEASVLEMLPLAITLLDQGQAEDVLARLETHSSPACFLYQAHPSDSKRGRCTVYPHRPSLCRLFGAGARLNKQGRRELSLCRVIKEQVAPTPEKLGETALEAPLMGIWKARVQAISCEISTINQPINLALKEALIKVLMASYYSYSQEA